MMEVLQNKLQIRDARTLMQRQRRSILEGKVAKILRRLGLLKRLPVGDMVKSWDVARTLDFIRNEVATDAFILDLGAYCSEVPVALSQMGFKNVHGIDLNPSVTAMPRSQHIRYHVGDFMHTKFTPSNFDVVTAISVIEHGYAPQLLLTEVSRLLRPGGYFIASFDYWPQKIDTSGTRFFGMPWLIFSDQDIEEMLKEAARHGLHAVGSVAPKVSDRAISFGGFEYTFGWLVLRKTL